MKTLLAALALLFALPAFGQLDPRIREGIALHDAGKYDEAIAKYREVLADEPGNSLATYEMGFAYFAKGDYASCRAALEPVANAKSPHQTQILVILGNCLDSAGERRRAIDVYRRGLKIDPNEVQLLYNLAISLKSDQKFREARELLKKELVLRPGHSSGHLALAEVFAAEGFRVPAILEYMRFLALETGTPRVAGAAEQLVALLNLGVDSKKPGEINITLPKKPNNAEGDFAAYELFLGMNAATQFTEEEAKLSEFERRRLQIANALRLMIESPSKDGSYTAKQNLPFFADLEARKLLDVFAGVAIASLQLPGAAEWGEANAAGISEYSKFLAELPR